MKYISTFFLGICLLFLFLHISEAARLLERCQAMGFDLRNSESSNAEAYRNRELWEITCYTTTGSIQETVKVCVDNSSQYPELVWNYGTVSTTPDYTYKLWRTILNDSLVNPAKRFSIWFEHQSQFVPDDNYCKAGGYWPLIRMCTFTSCYIGGHF